MAETILYAVICRNGQVVHEVKGKSVIDFKNTGKEKRRMEWSLQLGKPPIFLDSHSKLLLWPRKLLGRALMLRKPTNILATIFRWTTKTVFPTFASLRSHSRNSPLSFLDNSIIQLFIGELLDIVQLFIGGVTRNNRIVNLTVSVTMCWSRLWVPPTTPIPMSYPSTWRLNPTQLRSRTWYTGPKVRHNPTKLKPVFKWEIFVNNW